MLDAPADAGWAAWTPACGGMINPRPRDPNRSSDRNGKRTLIVAKTFAEAHAHAAEGRLDDWRFVSGVGDLAGVEPETHALDSSASGSSGPT